MKAKILSAIILVIVMCTTACAALPSVTILMTKKSPECEKMLSVIKQINSQYGARISASHLYLEDKPGLAEQYNIRYIPTLIFRDSDGKERARESGPRTLEQVLAVFENNGVKY